MAVSIILTAIRRTIMGLDNLVDIAMENGGKASMPLNNSTNNTQSLQTVSCNDVCPTNTYPSHDIFNETILHPESIEPNNTQYPMVQHPTSHMTPINTQQVLQPQWLAASTPNIPYSPLLPKAPGFIPPNPLSILENENYMLRTLKESKKNREERQHLDNVQYARNSVLFRQPTQLTTNVIPSNETLYFPHNFIDAAQEISTSTGLDAIGIDILILSSISIATWGRVSVRLDANWLEPAVSMILQVADAGSRKSGVVSSLRKPFEDFSSSKNNGREEEIEFTAKQSKLIEKESLKSISRDIAFMFKNDGINQETIERVKTISDDGLKSIGSYLTLSKKASLIQILIDNATPTALAKVLSEQGECQGCITAEGSMLQSHLLDKKAAPQLFNRLHTQESYVSASARAVSLKHPAFSMVNLVQPCIAIDFYKNDILNDLGVTGRFMPYFYCRHNATNNAIPSNNGINAYNQTITRLLNEYHTQDANAERFEATVTPEAYQLIKQFEQEVTQYIIPTMPRPAEPCLRKLHGQAVRFAWCIHAWNNDKPHCSAISADEMKQSIALCRHLLPHIKYAYDPCGLQAFDNAKKIVTCLQSINTGLGDEKLWNEGISSRTIQQRSHIKVKEVNNALRLLEQHNALTILDNGARDLTAVLHHDFFRFKWY